MISVSTARLLRLLTAVIALLLFAFVVHTPIAQAAVCGDANASGQIDIADAVYLINYIFVGGATPADDAHGDFNCNGQTDIVDAVFMVNYIFASGPAPCIGPLCGTGVLLSGGVNALAVSAIVNFGPFAADSSEIDSTGLLKTRLSALIHPDATVGEVNSALNSVNGKIAWMTPGDLAVTIAMAPVTSAAAADSIGTVLTQSGAFLTAYAAYGAGLNGTANIVELPPTGIGEIYHLCQMRMPAAWNVKKRAQDLNAPVTVLVPDGYYNQVPHPEIPSQTFLSGDGNPSLSSTTDGNHGFRSAGIIGALHDDKNTTGLHPGPAALVPIQSLMIGGLSLPEISSEIVDHMPVGRFVLNTSFGFSKDLDGFSKAKRAIQALAWRKQARLRKNDFFHVTSAGNEGLNTDDSRYAALSSTFTVAASFDSPFEMYSPGEIGLVDSLVLLTYWNYLLLTDPFVSLKMDNLIAVGSSDVSGNESSFSNIGSTVRVQGEEVAGPCVRPDPPSVDGGCFEDANGFFISYYDGTSFSAPQVAGLAAYLLNLDPTLTNSELKDIITHAYTESTKPGFVDAYSAVLALDKSAFDAPIRNALLDVASAPGVEGPDGFFDEFDIGFLLGKFSEYEQLRQGVPNAPEDYSRYDLNGDGYTGGNTFATKFDLDINDPPNYSVINLEVGAASHQYDENFLSDLDVLCYYANTTLYSGSQSALESLLVDCPACGRANKSPDDCFDPWIMEIIFPSAIYQTNPAPLQVRLGKTVNGVTIWQQNISIQLDPVGGTVSPEIGLTNSEGYFSSTATIAQFSDGIDINVTASEQGSIVATGLAHAVKSGAIHIYARETAAYGTFGTPSITPPCPPCFFGPFTASSSGSGANGSSAAINSSSVDTSSATNEIVFHFTGSSAAGNSDIHQTVTAYGSSSWKFEIFGTQDVAYSWEFSGSSSVSYGSAGFGLIVLADAGWDWYHEFISNHRGGVQEGDVAGSGTLYAFGRGYRVAANTYALGGTPTGSGSASLTATLKLVIPPGALIRISAEPQDTSVTTK